MRKFLLLACAGAVTACAQGQPDVEFIPSKHSALELRSVQTRLVPAGQDATMRGVVGVLHDLGYRITRVEPNVGTVSATRQTTLRMAVVVRPKDAATSIVRANATVLAPQKEAQVDAAEFYASDFFEPLAATMHRQLLLLPDDLTAPDAARPVGELNTAAERKAAAARQTSPSPATSRSSAQ